MKILRYDIQPCQLPPNLTIGLWVIVKYADEEYPEEVTSIEDSDNEVSVMHKSVNAWNWPRPKDKSSVQQLRLYELLTHLLLLAIEDSLCLKAFD